MQGGFGGGGATRVDVAKGTWILNMSYCCMLPLRKMIDRDTLTPHSRQETSTARRTAIVDQARTAR